MSSQHHQGQHQCMRERRSMDGRLALAGRYCRKEAPMEIKWHFGTWRIPMGISCFSPYFLSFLWYLLYFSMIIVGNILLIHYIISTWKYSRALHQNEMIWIDLREFHVLIQYRNHYWPGATDTVHMMCNKRARPICAHTAAYMCIYCNYILY